LQLDSIVDTAREASDTIAERMRALDAVPDGVDAADPTTADLLHGIIDSLEKGAWLLKSENSAA
jgi:starvation-inducible DNA-binding protein